MQIAVGVLRVEDLPGADLCSAPPRARLPSRTANTWPRTSSYRAALRGVRLEDVAHLHQIVGRVLDAGPAAGDGQSDELRAARPQLAVRGPPHRHPRHVGDDLRQRVVRRRTAAVAGAAVRPSPCGEERGWSSGCRGRTVDLWTAATSATTSRVRARSSVWGAGQPRDPRTVAMST